MEQTALEFESRPEMRATNMIFAPSHGSNLFDMMQRTEMNYNQESLVRTRAKSASTVGYVKSRAILKSAASVRMIPMQQTDTKNTVINSYATQARLTSLPFQRLQSSLPGQIHQGLNQAQLPS